MRKELLRFDRAVIDGTIRRARDIQLLLREGECVLLSGQDNSAAAEICRVFSGKSRLTGGRILLQGEEVTDPSECREKRQVFFMEPPAIDFGEILLCDYLFLLSGHQSLKGRIQRKAMRVMAAELFARYDLTWSPEQTFSSLSVADRRLLALIWAANQRIPLIVLYNAEQGLAGFEIRRMVSLIKRMKEEGTGFLIGTHHDRYYLEMADCIVRMTRGRIDRKYYDAESCRSMDAVLIRKNMESYPNDRHAPGGQ